MSSLEKERERREAEKVLIPMKEQSKCEKKGEIPKNAAPCKEEKQESESDFLRFVKLRIPGLMEENTAKPNPLATPPGMLAIQPEKNLKMRPSISQKEQVDEEAEALSLKNFPPLLKKKEETNCLSLIGEDGREAFKQSLENPGNKDAADKLKKREAAIAAQKVHNGDFSNYLLPPLTLLASPRIVDQSSIKKDLKRQAEVLEETLLSFGIEAKVGPNQLRSNHHLL